MRSSKALWQRGGSASPRILSLGPTHRQARISHLHLASTSTSSSRTQNPYQRVQERLLILHITLQKRGKPRLTVPSQPPSVSSTGVNSSSHGRWLHVGFKDHPDQQPLTPHKSTSTTTSLSRAYRTPRQHKVSLSCTLDASCLWNIDPL